MSAIRPQLVPPVRVERGELAKVIQPHDAGRRFEYTQGRLERVETAGAKLGSRIPLLEGRHFVLKDVLWSPGALDADQDGIADRVDPCIGSIGGDCANSDVDGDGQTPAGGDCNDMVVDVHTGDVERCNDIADNDCDGFAPPACVDALALPSYCAAVSAAPICRR